MLSFHYTPRVKLGIGVSLIVVLLASALAPVIWKSVGALLLPDPCLAAPASSSQPTPPTPRSNPGRVHADFSSNGVTNTTNTQTRRSANTARNTINNAVNNTTKSTAPGQGLVSSLLNSLQHVTQNVVQAVTTARPATQNSTLKPAPATTNTLNIPPPVSNTVRNTPPATTNSTNTGRPATTNTLNNTVSNQAVNNSTNQAVLPPGCNPKTIAASSPLTPSNLALHPDWPAGVQAYCAHAIHRLRDGSFAHDDGACDANPSLDAVVNYCANSANASSQICQAKANPAKAAIGATLADIPTATVFAKACPASATPSLVCKISLLLEPGVLVADGLKDTIQDSLEASLIQYLAAYATGCANLNPSQSFPPSADIQYNGATCSFPEGVIKGLNFVNVEVRIPFNSYSLPMAFTTKGEQSKLDETGTLTGYVSGTVQVDLKSRRSQPEYTYLDGLSLDGLMNFSLNSSADLFAVSDPPDIHSQIYQDSNSYWTLSVNGTVSSHLKVGGQLDAKKNFHIDLQSFDFCPTTCTITTTEKQHLEEELKNQEAQGSVTSDVTHSETYTGTGAYNKSTDTLSWNPDVKIVKQDNRSWEHELTQGSNAWCYKGSTDGYAVAFPYNQSQNHYSSDSIKDLTYEQHLPDSPLPLSSYHPLFCAQLPNTPLPGYGIGSAHIKTHEEQRPAPAQEQPLAELVSSRTGSATSIFGNTVTGAYNKTDLVSDCTGTVSGAGQELSGCGNSLLITGRTDKAGTVSHLDDGTKIDLFQGLERFTQSYADNLKVPGYFTADSAEAGKTVLSTEPVKVLPKQINLFESFAADDEVGKLAQTPLIEKYLNSLRQYGVSINIVDTSSPAKFMDALNTVQNGSWLVNVGHGGPGGLVTGENNSKNITSYQTIQNALKDKAVTLSLFAADSCFSSHSPLAPTVIGSVSVGIATNTIDSWLGHIVGIGGNSFHQALSDLMSKLSQVTGVPATCSTGP